MTEKQKKWEMSESLILGYILALSGGFMDAYTYLYRGGVYANAQTGNLINLGINISNGNLSASLQFFFPVFAFAIGVFSAKSIRIINIRKPKFHWRQLCLIIEIVIMLAVSQLNTNYNLLANSLISFACGIQVQTIRKIHNNVLATTMCIGNLRTGTDHLSEYLFSKNKENLKSCLLYYSIIIMFTLGAVSGKYLVYYFNQYAIIVSAAMLFIAFSMMFIDRRISY